MACPCRWLTNAKLSGLTPPLPCRYGVIATLTTAAG